MYVVEIFAYSRPHFSFKSRWVSICRGLSVCLSLESNQKFFAELAAFYFSALFVLDFLFFLVCLFFFVFFGVGLRGISSSMGNEYQQEDLYDFRFDVAADQSVDRDSDCPELDFPGGADGGELGAVEELARLAEEAAAAAAGAQQPGRGSPPASMSKITSAGT